MDTTLVDTPGREGEGGREVNEQIRPCPFCGESDPPVVEVDVRVWARVCNGCGCTGPLEEVASTQTPQRATELWNRRAESTRH